jgi:hypothetical protein
MDFLTHALGVLFQPPEFLCHKLLHRLDSQIGKRNARIVNTIVGFPNYGIRAPNFHLYFLYHIIHKANIRLDSLHRCIDILGVEFNNFRERSVARVS